VVVNKTLTLCWLSYCESKGECKSVLSAIG